MSHPVFRFYTQSAYLIISFFFGLGLVHFFFFESTVVDGVSMQETFHDGDMLLIAKIPLLFRTPARGDIVSINKGVAGTLVVKRIVGLPGEQVAIKSGKIYITNFSGEVFILNEHYLPENLYTLPAEGYIEDYGIIPEHHYFVLGDNRGQSKDSRHYGFVDRKEIVGVIQTLDR